MSRRTAVAAMVLAAAVAGVSTAAAAGAQSWRTAHVGRASADSAPLAVSVRYAAGDFAVRAAPSGWLYDAAVTYDAERVDPVYRYDAAARTFAIAVDRGTMSWPGAREGSAEFRLALGAAAPLELDITTGAVAADVDLTGLRVRGLAFETRYSDATVHFDRPNVERMPNLRLAATGARLRAVRLANANAPRVSLRARGSQAILDLTGQWTGDIALTLDALMTRIVVRVPSDVGIRYAVSGSFAGSPGGLVQRDDAWVSENDGAARHHLVVTGTLSFGQVVIERVSR